MKNASQTASKRVLKAEGRRKEEKVIEEHPWYEIYRMPKVKRLTGLSRSSIYRLEALGLFPGRVKLSGTAVGWRSDEIHAWISARPQAAIARGAK